MSVRETGGIWKKVSGLYQCQLPACDTVITATQDGTPWGTWGGGTTLGPFRYDFVQLHVTLQSPANKKLKKCIGNK